MDHAGPDLAVTDLSPRYLRYKFYV